MDNKKQQILDSSLKLFLEKGFQRTSVQDIAEACNMSKATIYRYFTAKEDIGLNVALYVNRHLIYQMRELDRKQDLDNIAVLKAQIYLLITDYNSKSKFLDILYFFLSKDNKDQYLPILGKSRFLVFCEYAKSIQKAFNLSSEPFAWELAINMQGIIREITFLDDYTGNVSGGVLPLNRHMIVEFIIDSLLAIGENRANHPPLFSDEKVASIKVFFEVERSDFKPLCQRAQLLDELRHKISDASPAKLHKDLLEAVTLLEQELEKPMPKKLLIHSLWLYLVQRDELTDLLDELKNLINL